MSSNLFQTKSAETATGDFSEKTNETIQIENETPANGETSIDAATPQATEAVVDNIDGGSTKKSNKCCRCNKQACKAFAGRVCPYFPRCCQIPLQTCLQLLAMTDLFVAIINIGIWLYFHQYDPFAHVIDKGTNKSDVQTSVDPAGSPSTEPLYHNPEFHESTTSSYKNLANSEQLVDAEKYSKIGFVQLEYQQEVVNMCGREYYAQYLLGHELELTKDVFSDLLALTYLSECVYQFNDISILATTCCFFEYTSGRLFLIIIWNMELVPLLAKLYLIVESRSHRLCILQYGLGKTFRGLDCLFLVHFLPMILFRAYKLLVFTFFVESILELGNLEHQTRIQGVTLHDHMVRHDEYLRMDRNRDRSSSEDEDIDNV